MKDDRPRLWPVVLAIAVLASIEALLHLWIQFAPPDGCVPTGMHTGDSGHHLLSMRAFGNGLHSPFATCRADDGGNGFGYFAVPIFLLYAMLGEVGRAVTTNDFLFLGFANGIAAALYLTAVYRFLVAAAPRYGRTAFFLFALGGGIGGPLYLAARFFGIADTPGFEQGFMRAALYTLIEGQYPAPYLQFARFYYTLPLAFGFWSLKVFVDALRIPCTKHALFAGILLCFPAFFNLRLGPLFQMVALLYLVSQPGITVRAAWAYFRPYLILGLLATFAGWWCMQLHPAYGANVRAVTSSVALFLPLLFALLPFVPAVTAGLGRFLEALGPVLRIPALAALGYIVSYALLYAGHQAYYGNYFMGGDAGAAWFASDPALLGALAGALLGCAKLMQARAGTASPVQAEDDRELPVWAFLWMLLFGAASICAAGGGAFAQLAPARFMIMLGVPVALVAAVGLERLHRYPRRTLRAGIYGCGIVSIFMGTLYFQGPWGAGPGKDRPFGFLHYEFMTPMDARLLELLPEGTVAVPPWSPIAFGEIIAVHKGNTVIGGPGALNLGEQPFSAIQGAVGSFFDPATPALEREAFLRNWCVDLVYLPDTCPQPKALRDALALVPGLTLLDQAGSGAIYRFSPPGA
ncbi:MAG: hypothetical protein HYV27_25120 [Candidatus Hydrogenedentes bacterium]|nr:hypothetical protein [Candidatus Hydrogenedentota bacterium]